MPKLTPSPPSPPLHVTRDASGVPVAWKLLQKGDNPLIRNGVAANLKLDDAALSSIIGYHREKGEKIPVDSDHFLYYFAAEKQLEESEVLKFLPSGRGAMGFGTLVLRGDALWLENVEWNHTAYEIMRGGLFRYHSPVIRGLRDGPIRLTSVSMVNEPALNDLDSLAAGAEANLDVAIFSSEIKNTAGEPGRKTPHMKKLEELLARLTGSDSVSLGAEGENPALVTKLGGICDELESGRRLRKSVTESLTLGAQATESEIIGAVAGLKESARSASDANKRLDTMELSAARAEGVAAGKLTNAMLGDDFYKNLDAAGLRSFLRTAPVIVPPVLPLGAEQPGVAVCAASDKILDRLGLTDDEKKKATENNKGACQ